MNVSRYSQVRSLHRNRSELLDNLEEINSDLIDEIWEDNLKKYILEKLADFSLDEIENLKLKLINYRWTDLKRDAKLIQSFYSLLTKKILLPSWIDKRDYNKVKEALDAIIKRYNRKLNDEIIKLNDVFFNLCLWDLKNFDYEIEEEYEIMPKNFTLWGIFWQLYMWINEKEERYATEIPIRLNMKKDCCTEQKYVDVDKIKEIVAKYFPKKPKAWDRFWDFRIKTCTKVDKELMYWPYPDVTYFVITIYDNKNKYLNVDYINQDEILKSLKTYLEINNLLINEIENLSSINHWKRHFSFFSSHPFLFINWDFWINEDINEKFSKLLVKMKKPVYLSDIWWQEKAKKEINKIIIWLKNKEIMSEWWWKSTPWALMYWPPWTGKTLLAMVLATEVNADVFNIKMTDIADSAYINDWSKNVKNLFEYLRHKAKEDPNKKIIIILDEMDALLKKRTWDRQSDEDKKVVTTFLTEMNWFDTINNVIFVGTTNNYHSLDSAVTRTWRFSTKIKFELPDEEWRKDIFNIHMNKAKKVAKRRDIFAQVINLNELAKMSEWLSWSDIEDVIRMTIENKVIEQVNKIWTWEETSSIDENDIVHSINELKTSNWKANEIIKSFWIESLLKELKWENRVHFLEWIHRIISDKTVQEIRTATDSWKITTGQLIEIYELLTRKKAGYN